MLNNEVSALSENRLKKGSINMVSSNFFVDLKYFVLLVSAVKMKAKIDVEKFLFPSRLLR